MNHSGRHVLVLSNQRGVALGLCTCADVDRLRRRLQQHLAEYGASIEAFYYCPHDENQCDCRKPKPGLIYKAFRDFPDANPANSLVIGDSISDIEAAHGLDIPAIFIQGDPATQKAGAGKARPLIGNRTSIGHNGIPRINFCCGPVASASVFRQQSRT
jgi:D-glycero-D-manno-heptose 1,7-bisphosphate phosphatase